MNHAFIIILVQGLAIEVAEKRGVPVTQIQTTAWHAVLLFKVPHSNGSLAIWDPVKRVHKYPFIFTKDQGATKYSLSLSHLFLRLKWSQ